MTIIPTDYTNLINLLHTITEELLWYRLLKIIYYLFNFKNALSSDASDTYEVSDIVSAITVVGNVEIHEAVYNKVVVWVLGKAYFLL